MLILFDNPVLYEHLNAVQATWNPAAPGGIGRRWSQAVCAAAWRVLVAEEPGNVNGNNFRAPSAEF